MDNELSDFEKYCYEDINSLSEYRRRLSDELSEGFNQVELKGFVNIEIYSLDKILKAWCFHELKGEVLKSFCDKHKLRLLKKEKIMSIETRECSPVYNYIFVADTEKHIDGFLSLDVTVMDNSNLFNKKLDEEF